MSLCPRHTLPVFEIGCRPGRPGRPGESQRDRDERAGFAALSVTHSRSLPPLVWYWLVGAILLSTPAVGSGQGSAAGDRAALEALYDATNGARWLHNANWKTDAPLGQWYGVGTDDDGRVTDLSLYRNQLSGPIPSELGNLTRLGSLWLSENELSGPIPAELGNLTRLINLSLPENQLTGPIPSWLGNLTRLGSLTLGNNQLSGPIPAELGNLTSLWSLWLPDNQLTGRYPPNSGNLTSLTELVLYRNQLSGPIPSWLGNLTRLEWLNLGNNQLSGPIPSELGNLTSLTELVLHDNQLSGPIPSELGNLTRLGSLTLSNNQLSGPDTLRTREPDKPEKPVAQRQPVERPDTRRTREPDQRDKPACRYHHRALFGSELRPDITVRNAVWPVRLRGGTDGCADAEGAGGGTDGGERCHCGSDERGGHEHRERIGDGAVGCVVHIPVVGRVGSDVRGNVVLGVVNGAGRGLGINNGHPVREWC